MAAKMKKADLVAKCRELGIEPPERATAAQLAAILAEAEEACYPKQMTVSCDGYPALNVRKAPSAYAPVVGHLDDGASITVHAVQDGWAKVDGGYCSAKYLA